REHSGCADNRIYLRFAGTADPDESRFDVWVTDRGRGFDPQEARKRRPRSGEAHKRSEEHTSELQSQSNLVCRLLLEKKKSTAYRNHRINCHNTGLDGLTDTATFDHARCDFFERIKGVGLDWTFAIQRLAQRIKNPSV